MDGVEVGLVAGAAAMQKKSSVSKAGVFCFMFFSEKNIDDGDTAMNDSSRSTQLLTTGKLIPFSF